MAEHGFELGLDWSEDEDVTRARDEVDIPAHLVPSPPAEVPSEPHRTLLGVGLAYPRDVVAMPEDEAHLTRPVPGGSRGGYLSPAELEELPSYERPTRRMDMLQHLGAQTLIGHGALGDGSGPRLHAPGPRALDPEGDQDDLVGPAALQSVDVDADLDAETRPLLAIAPVARSPIALRRPAAGAPAPSSAPPAAYVLPSHRTTTHAMAVRPRARGGAKSRGSWVMLGAMVVLGLGLGMWLGAPREGALNVEVANAGEPSARVGAADVFVDGDLRCRSVPCTVRGLEPGFRAVRVEVPGRRTATMRTAEVLAGESSDLRVELPAPPLRGIRVGAVAGVREVFVDGVSRGAPPVEILDLEPGVYAVELVGEGGLRHQRRVEVEEGAVVELRDVVMAAPVPPADRSR